jgi:hypothetical protein
MCTLESSRSLRHSHRRRYLGGVGDSAWTASRTLTVRPRSVREGALAQVARDPPVNMVVSSWKLCRQLDAERLGGSDLERKHGPRS